MFVEFVGPSQEQYAFHSHRSTSSVFCQKIPLAHTLQVHLDPGHKCCVSALETKCLRLIHRAAVRAGIIVQKCRPNDPVEEISLSCRDLHVVDIVIANMSSVCIRPVDVLDHITKPQRHRKCARVLVHPYAVNICAKAFPVGEKCRLTPECIRTNVVVEQKANINQGTEINSR